MRLEKTHSVCFGCLKWVEKSRLSLSQDSGDVILSDTSLNGTYVNGTLVGKGNELTLSSGDSAAVKNMVLR